ncbi:NAD(P)-binding domain-containing protein [bacterium]|nr:NAD(P)-binding domain-containing protein [bacterium]
MTIGIIGVGNVGATLGKRWAQAGYHVLFGVRDPNAEKVRRLLEEAGSNACTESIDDIAKHTSVILLATPHSALRAITEQMGNLRSNILVDCTNPIAPGLRLAVGHSSSGAEQLARWVNDTPVVKAFNTMGWESMQQPDFNGTAATMFLCGDNKKANETVRKMAADIGFDAVITGPLQHARYLEPMAMLWIEMAMKHGFGRDTAFHLLRRGESEGS